jgi:serine protease AprX
MTRRSPLYVCAALAAAMLAPDAWAQGRPKKLDQALSDGVYSGSNSGSGGGQTRVIVQYREGSGDKVRRRAEARGGKVRTQHQIINAVSIEVDGKDIQSLVNDPDVLNISLDARVRSDARRDENRGGGSGNPAQKKGPGKKIENAHLLRDILGAPAGLTGREVGVAIIDSGIAATPDLAVAATFDFTGSGEPVLIDPRDDYGHGTHVAGLIAGNGTLSSGKYRGIAPSVRLYSFKVLDEKGQGYTSDVIEALDMAAQYPEYIQIINLSLGHPIYEPAATDPLVQAVERAVRKGILVVTSAGNHGEDEQDAIGYGGITSPGNAPSALTVGSMKTLNTVSRLDDAISRFSSRGPTWFDGLVKPDVVAPGENLVAISTTNTRLYSKESLRADVAPYIRLTGTSMATAVTTAVAALIIEANYLDEGYGKPLTPNAIKAILQHSALQVPDFDPLTPDVLEQGAGGVNAGGAVALARAIEPSAPLGAYWLETPVVESSTFDGVALPWSEHIVWGDSVVGNDAIYWNLPTWDEHIVWGDSIDWGSAVDWHIVWGDSIGGLGGTTAWHIVWGDLFEGGIDVVSESFLTWSNQIVWGDHLVWGEAEHIVWGDLLDQHIVWGDAEVDLYTR